MKKIAVLLLICLLALPALAQDDEPTTLRWGFPADGTTFNTVTQSEAVDSFLQGLVFPDLMTTDPETGDWVPELATWEVSDDGTVYTFSIDPDALWSDGTPITSEDVRFTFDATRSENVQTFRAPDYEAINILDDKTFEVVLEAPNCNILTDLSIRIMPAHVFADDYSDFMTSDFNTGPTVAGGPFIFVERAVDEFLRFRANPDYHLGQPNIDQVLVQIMPDNEVRFQAMSSGQLDLAPLPQEQVDLLVGNPNVEVISYPVNGWWSAAFNLADPENPQPAFDDDGNRNDQDPHPILGDVRVREALVLGWDHEDAQFLSPTGELLYGPIMPVLPQYLHPELEIRPYDPDAAADLLTEAGWVDNDGDGVRENADGEPLALDFYYTTGNEINPTLMADYWGDLGADINLISGEQGALLNEVYIGQTFDLFYIGGSWSQPTPDLLLNFFFNSANDLAAWNGNSFANEEVDSLLAELVTAPCDDAGRAPIYHRIQEIFYEEIPNDFVITQVGNQVVSTRVGNVVFDTWGANNINEWTIEN